MTGAGGSERDAPAEPLVLGPGFVHYSGDVYVHSSQRPGAVHFDLTFQLYGADKVHYPFRDCDPTGKYKKGVDQPLLRSKIAVKRYLEREGERENLTDEQFEEKWTAALAESKTLAEAKAKEDAAKKAAIDAEFEAAYAAANPGAHAAAVSPGKLVAPGAKVPKGIRRHSRRGSARGERTRDG